MAKIIRAKHFDENNNEGRDNNDSQSSSSTSTYIDYCVWDNHPLKCRGIDCDNDWKDHHRKEISLKELYKARYESFPTQRQKIAESELE